MGLPPTDAPDRGDGTDLPSWRVTVAIGVLLLLAGGLIVVSQRSPDAAPTVTTRASVPITSPPAAGRDDDLIADVGASLTAWGEFATTGDLDRIGAHFDPSGPQHRQLAAEAASMAPSSSPNTPGYRFALTSVEVVERTDDRAVVRSGLTMTSSTGDREVFRWDIEMRRAGSEDRWRLWTVITTP